MHSSSSARRRHYITTSLISSDSLIVLEMEDMLVGEDKKLTAENWDRTNPAFFSRFNNGITGVEIARSLCVAHQSQTKGLADEIDATDRMLGGPTRW
jgi:hypothetical protein